MSRLLLLSLTCLLALYTATVTAVHGSQREPDFGASILSRSTWQAKPPLPGMHAQIPTGIIIHHTGTRINDKLTLSAKMQSLQSFSQNPGEVSPNHHKPAWPDVPYHFYIDGRGQVAQGRDVEYAGDTNTSYDTTGYIQIVVEGNFELEQPRTPQLIALQRLLRWVAAKWNIPLNRISLHKDHAETVCPGKHLIALMPQILDAVSRQGANGSGPAGQR